MIDPVVGRLHTQSLLVSLPVSWLIFIVWIGAVHSAGWICGEAGCHEKA
jgi:hypothetical protein